MKVDLRSSSLPAWFCMGIRRIRPNGYAWYLTTAGKENFGQCWSTWSWILFLLVVVKPSWTCNLPRSVSFEDRILLIHSVWLFVHWFRWARPSDVQNFSRWMLSMSISRLWLVIYSSESMQVIRYDLESCGSTSYHSSRTRNQFKMCRFASFCSCWE